MPKIRVVTDPVDVISDWAKKHGLRADGWDILDPLNTIFCRSFVGMLTQCPYRKRKIVVTISEDPNVIVLYKPSLLQKVKKLAKLLGYKKIILSREVDHEDCKNYFNHEAL